jgi:predicted nucleotide-binding protein
MAANEPLRLIRELIAEFESLEHPDTDGVGRLRKRGRMILSNLFGEKSRQFQEFEGVSFWPNVYPTTEHRKRESFASCKNETLHVLRAAAEEIELFGLPTQKRHQPGKGTAYRTTKSNRIFIVHGHDEEMKQATARVVATLGLQPVILHEMPDRGQTIIEKLESNSDVGFAIVLLSGDDRAYRKDANPEQARPRARQNVVFEWGFFVCALGRANVLALHRPEVEFEMPSDLSGVLYKPYDSAGAWRLELVGELRAAEYEVSADDLLPPGKSKAEFPQCVAR